MKINRNMSPQTEIRIQGIIFTFLCLAVIGLAAKLSHHYPLAYDWTGGQRNSLSAASRKVLDTLPEPIRITGFVADNNTLRGAMAQLVARYQRYRSDIQLEFINPQLKPALAEQYAVLSEGELVIDYSGRREHVRRLAETALSTALARLARGAERWAVYLQDYSNRQLDGGRRTDFDQLSSHLETLGLKLRPFELTANVPIPDNVSLVVVAHTIRPLTDSASKSIRSYIERGGNLLWFADPGTRGHLNALTEVLGVNIEPGMLVDPTSKILNQSAPEFIQVRGYADHPLSAGLQEATIFPTAASLSWQAPVGWQVRGIAASPLNSWRETGDLSVAVRFDEQSDSPGPADLAVAMQRVHSDTHKQQRVVIVGDSDFASNGYLGLGENRAFAVNMFNWLSADDALLNLPVIAAFDLNFNPAPIPKAVIVLGAPIVLPLIVFGFGLIRWQRRRHL
jgi:ABC-type uncharacterized transport system involved in gliding motility auxiliary subunit